jgi:hypothetical protein
MSHIMDKPVLLCDRNTVFPAPKRVSDVVMWTLKKKPHRRPKSVEDLARALQEVLDSEHVTEEIPGDDSDVKAPGAGSATLQYSRLAEAEDTCEAVAEELEETTGEVYVSESDAPLAEVAAASGQPSRGRLKWVWGGLIAVVVGVSVLFLYAPFSGAPGVTDEAERDSGRVVDIISATTRTVDADVDIIEEFLSADIVELTKMPDDADEPDSVELLDTVTLQSDYSESDVAVSDALTGEVGNPGVEIVSAVDVGRGVEPDGQSDSKDLGLMSDMSASQVDEQSERHKQAELKARQRKEAKERKRKEAKELKRKEEEELKRKEEEELKRKEAEEKKKQEDDPDDDYSRIPGS